MGWALNSKIWGRLKDYRFKSHWKVAERFATEHNLKPVEKKDMVLGKSYIALRITLEDFHFMRRGPQGHWTHKQGGTCVETISQKEVFAAEWSGWNTYGGKIWLYEVGSLT